MHTVLNSLEWVLLSSYKSLSRNGSGVFVGSNELSYFYAVFVIKYEV